MTPNTNIVKYFYPKEKICYFTSVTISNHIILSLTPYSFEHNDNGKTYSDILNNIFIQILRNQVQKVYLIIIIYVNL